jgi:hypothetical protein
MGIAILPAKQRGGNKYDTERVRIDWAGELISRALDEAEGLAVDEGGNLYEIELQGGDKIDPAQLQKLIDSPLGRSGRRTRGVMNTLET